VNINYKLIGGFISTNIGEAIGVITYDLPDDVDKCDKQLIDRSVLATIKIGFSANKERGSLLMHVKGKIIPFTFINFNRPLIKTVFGSFKNFIRNSDMVLNQSRLANYWIKNIGSSKIHYIKNSFGLYSMRDVTYDSFNLFLNNQLICHYRIRKLKESTTPQSQALSWIKSPLFLFKDKNDNILTFDKVRPKHVSKYYLKDRGNQLLKSKRVRDIFLSKDGSIYGNKSLDVSIELCNIWTIAMLNHRSSSTEESN
jgi:hypothetical protein